MAPSKNAPTPSSLRASTVGCGAVVVVLLFVVGTGGASTRS
jgi:hypothetical protein